MAWLVGWLVGRLVSWLVGWWLVGRAVGRKFWEHCKIFIFIYYFMPHVPLGVIRNDK